MEDYTPEDIQNMDAQTFAEFVRKCLIESENRLRLAEYKLVVADTVIMYLAANLDRSDVEANDVDQRILEMYSKVSVSESFETAEAHFNTTADVFSKRAGFKGFEDMIELVKSGLENMKEGETFDDVVRNVISNPDKKSE